ncbi:MAG: hypothetical protein CVV56_07970 [Tenericutes bacterium HGW-Tenericutes-1]|jgi:transcriptional regulator with XRE-family HTH domain|nr:MAG: hypothetical protein CVV56_07970 [Tenericutes bacterium HGW-Tenericutes-1]PKM95783.1 MAG: hypothetical protein CVU84_03000 [Firmicutes bacterium HGW-Firmicutes-1]
MCVATVIKEARESNKLTQDQMAYKFGVSRSTYSAYERKTRPIPDDLVLKIADEFNDQQIIAEFSYEKGTEFFNVPVLDNVDKYPQVVMDILIEEASEMIKALLQIKNIIKNKTRADQIGKDVFERLMEQEEQVGDVYTALKMHFITMQKYGVNVKDVERRCVIKLRNKGLIKKEKARLGRTY